MTIPRIEFATDHDLLAVAVIKSTSTVSDDAIVAYSMNICNCRKNITTCYPTSSAITKSAGPPLAAPKIVKSIAFPNVGTVT